MLTPAIKENVAIIIKVTATPKEPHPNFRKEPNNIIADTAKNSSPRIFLKRGNLFPFSSYFLNFASSLLFLSSNDNFLAISITLFFNILNLVTSNI